MLPLSHAAQLQSQFAALSLHHLVVVADYLPSCVPVVHRNVLLRSQLVAQLHNLFAASQHQRVVAAVCSLSCVHVVPTSAVLQSQLVAHNQHQLLAVHLPQHQHLAVHLPQHQLLAVHLLQQHLAVVVAR